MGTRFANHSQINYKTEDLKMNCSFNLAYLIANYYSCKNSTYVENRELN